MLFGGGYKKEKKNITAYFIFLEEQRWRAVLDKSELNNRQIVNQAYHQWNNMNQEQRQIYEDLTTTIKTDADLEKHFAEIQEQTKPQQKEIKKKIKKQRKGSLEKQQL